MRARSDNSLAITSDTAFKQQRLKAWQPILTPKSVLPTLLIVGLIFAPIGGVLIWGSNQVCGFPRAHDAAGLAMAECGAVITG
jgi:hypothetical protein